MTTLEKARRILIEQGEDPPYCPFCGREEGTDADPLCPDFYDPPFYPWSWHHQTCLDDAHRWYEERRAEQEKWREETIPADELRKIREQEDADYKLAEARGWAIDLP